MNIRVWGARGSIPVSGREYLKYGGDTTCLEVRTKDDDIIIIDAGTGLRRLGNLLVKEGRTEYHMLFTHVHWDHLLGFGCDRDWHQAVKAIRRPTYNLPDLRPPGAKRHFHECSCNGASAGHTGAKPDSLPRSRICRTLSLVPRHMIVGSGDNWSGPKTLSRFASNPSATNFQGNLTAGEGLSAAVLRQSQQWATAGHIGYVVGATYPEELAMARQLAPAANFLIPGIGAQGGSLETAVTHGPDALCGPVISASRSVIYAALTPRFAEEARTAAQQLRDAINAIRDQVAM